MELVMRLPRGPRERVTSQTTRPTATTSIPPLIKIRFLKPESADMSAAGAATAFESVTIGGLVAATISVAVARGIFETGSGAGFFWMTGAGIGAGLTGADGFETGAGLGAGVATIFGAVAGRLVAVAFVAGCGAA